MIEIFLNKIGLFTKNQFMEIENRNVILNFANEENKNEISNLLYRVHDLGEIIFHTSGKNKIESKIKYVSYLKNSKKFSDKKPELLEELKKLKRHLQIMEKLNKN